MKGPTLLFEFSDHYGAKSPKRFVDPERVISAETVEQVEQAFLEVEQALQQGFYAAGFVSYEAAPAFDKALKVHSNSEWPLVWFGIFNEPVSTEASPRSDSFQVSDWLMEGDYNQYKEGIREIKKAIKLGETYQVNYTTRLKADFTGNEYAFYRKLAAAQKSSYSAYINTGTHQLLSASPELFFRIDDGTITTKPMKGTAPRGRFLEEDEKRKADLLRSEKERSENLMIVDLLRNDLGRIALPGSVHVPELFEVETYPTVHQMTSTIKGQLDDSFSMWDVFQALFPCGSITGAPKVRTMEYIRELEHSPREVYCGAIGYMTPEKEAVFNVPIRTVMLNNGTAAYGTGGGVTWESTSEGEYEEIHTKARLLTETVPEFRLLETMRLDDGRISLLPYHLKRVQNSSDYFGFKVDQALLLRKISEITSLHREGLHKVRMLVDQEGNPEIECRTLDEFPSALEAELADQPVDEQDPFLFHKTTHRKVYEKHQKKSRMVLLWNQKGELTEFTIANLVVKFNGEFYTPPISCGLLSGTYRKQLIEEGKLKEQVLRKEELEKYQEIWMINSVRGWVRVHLMD
ncbi:para-aminobenzoate synthetase / 4-amino-4-deoxychorismate lyase [Halobacillus alkaliphilus]|uniref:Para-aminobenzoate synthetase / 4-amino-4-deoxychorismate lyase n=1 Tax=Halobacillus alkaliphilus TaxID=396056 RepID=A0A1I2M0S8_9BACI|nr:aminodeoxychorismate synthase component I [Halobacillus alkaliphilus]SFF82901.1 para-aminobenzoate synthetase / 4-amino-4-deoxychorismate lyase [Halobacillus alkaliphilus]